MDDGFAMITNAIFQDTPSIVGNEITTARVAGKLAYSQLMGREKRDYLFRPGHFSAAESKGQRIPDIDSQVQRTTYRIQAGPE
jgi:hypothetical protein